MTPALRSMTGLIQKMFGDHFWKNVILEVRTLVFVVDSWAKNCREY
jgi:hypothetical protein